MKDIAGTVGGHASLKCYDSFGDPLAQAFHDSPIEVENKRQIRTSGFTLIGLGNVVSGAFTSVPAKHTKHLSLVDILAVGVDRMERNFEPMRKQVEAWKGRAFRTRP